MSAPIRSSLSLKILRKPEVETNLLPGGPRMTGFARSSEFQWMIICTCVYKFASHSSQSLLTMFLVDDGETISRLGFLSGVAGQFISIAVASVTGMILAAKW